MAQLQDPIVPQAPHNPLAPYISSMVATAAISARRRQLEDQLLKMELQNSQAEQRLALQHLNYESLDAARRAQIEHYGAETENIKRKAEDAIQASNDKAAWETGIAELTNKYLPGTKPFIDGANVLRPQALRYLSTPEGKRDWSELISGHERGAKAIVDAQAGLTKSYNDQLDAAFGKKGWRRDYGVPNLDKPDKWDMVDASGNSTDDPQKTVERVLKLDEHGEPLPPKTTKHAYAVPIPAARFNDILDYRAHKDAMDAQIQSGYLHPDLQAASAQIKQEAAPPKVLDAVTAKQFLQQAGGDKQKARELAREAGYHF